ncbi:DUF2931 family protein [Pseudomonas sp.]|uniref:DUF2931 family protein n=1 Tax=Pseudomonas sp. TaxID=306 RepID=UPI0028A927C5|nr:DUF2931 family protein [Pseudomonas sp.]
MGYVLNRLLIAVVSLCYLAGCQSPDPLSGERDPKDRWWNLEFVAPIYMTAWVEASLVEDIQGNFYNHGSAGLIGSGEYGHKDELARGWPDGLSGSGIRGVVGADLPKRIFVRWQSVVESHTYRAWIDIPDEARVIMHDATHRRCPETPDRSANYMASLYLGLAPGGVIQAWVRDRCLQPIKVARGKAEVEPLGPHLGQSGGHYYPQPRASKRYVQMHGIPYGSW